MKLQNIGFNFTDAISKGALLSVLDKDGRKNTMTVSWGQAGILWNREICTVYVRPERHTFSLCENAEVFSLSFFGEEKKDALSFCGTKTGRDVDKFDACSLSHSLQNGAIVFDDAHTTLILKVLYKSDIQAEKFLSDTPLSFYKSNGFHRAYTCEITNVLQK